MKKHPSGDERCPAEEVPGQSGGYRGGPCTFPRARQLGPEQGTAVHEYNTQGREEGVLAFLVPSSQCTAALNGIHHDAGHQGQQRTLALAVVTKDQTAKTIAKVLYERFIMVFGTPAKFLSDW